MGKLKKIKVHIADDHMVLIDGIKAVLKTDKEIEVVGCSVNGQEVLEWHAKNTSDVLVLDINMPKVDGIKVLREFSKRDSKPQIIVLSSYDDQKLVNEVLKIGASGFLAKKCAGEDILEAIKVVHQGEQYFSEEIQRKIVSIVSKEDIKSTSQDGNYLSSLTEREVEVLKLIAQEFSTKGIAYELGISFNTVESHRKNLLRKLNVKNAIGLAIYAHKNQLV